MNEALKNRAIPLAALATVTTAMAYHWTRHLDERAAISGFSPEQAAIVTNNPSWFLRDFPSGIQETLNSVVFWVYVLADRLGLSLTGTWAVMTWLEIVVFAGAAYYATRRLFPDESWQLPTIVSVLFVSSPLLQPDLGRFGYPYYGWMYGFAHACFLVCAANVLRRNLARAGLAAVAAFLIHPITGLFAAAFSFAVLLARLLSGHSGDWRRASLFAVSIGGVFAAWTLLLSANSTITGGAVDPADFVTFTRAQNYHWYPSFLGVFWELHPQHLMPLVASLALIAWAFHALPSQREAGIVAGLLMLGLVCIAGVVVAEYTTVPTLIKLCLQRADRSILLIGAIFAIKALLDDLRGGGPFERGFAAVLLLLPFQSEYGLAIGPIALRVAYAVAMRRQGGGFSPPLAVATGFCVLALALWLVYALSGVAAGHEFYIGLNPYLIAAGLAGAVSTASFLKTRHRWLHGLLFMAIVGLAVKHSDTGNELSSKAKVDKARDYLGAQLWARANTPVGALFMVDPGMGYMWRDKSYRPSFGTPREWLMLSIMYNSRKTLFDEGMKRYMALGLPFPEYLHDPANRRTGPLLTRIAEDASNAYNAKDVEALARLAGQFGIEYFVFDRTRATALGGLTVVFENAHLAIALAPKAR